MLVEHLLKYIFIYLDTIIKNICELNMPGLQTTHSIKNPKYLKLQIKGTLIGLK